MIRSFRYPLHPTQSQAASLTLLLGACCDLYNGAVQERRDAWTWRKTQALCRGLVSLPRGKTAKPRKVTKVVKAKVAPKVDAKAAKPVKPKSLWLAAVGKAARKVGGADTTYVSQCRALTEIRATVPGWSDVPCNIARSALDRADKSFVAFFRRFAAGEKPGYPRFKAKRRCDSFSIGSSAAASHARGTLIRDGRVNIPRLGYVRFNQYRPIPVGARVLDVIVRREAGKWYVIFQCDVGAAPARVDLATVTDERIVGIDVGLTTLATLSTGEPIANPRHGKTAAKRVAAEQRSLARKQRGSKSRRRAIVTLQRCHAHVRNQRLDTARKAAAVLVSRYDVICFEDLSIGRMVHGNLAKSIYDAAWGLLIAATTCKAESAGKYVVATDPRGTTIECSRCGTAVPKRLDERTHKCPTCGLTIGRDVNAAHNIRERGRRSLGLLATQGVTDEDSTEASQQTGRC